MDGAGFKTPWPSWAIRRRLMPASIRCPLRTVQNWADWPPEAIAHLLQIMLRQRIRSPRSLTPATDDSAAIEASAALEGVLRWMLHRAERAGWPPKTAAAGAITWLAIELSREG